MKTSLMNKGLPCRRDMSILYRVLTAVDRTGKNLDRKTLLAFLVGLSYAGFCTSLAIFVRLHDDSSYIALNVHDTKSNRACLVYLCLGQHRGCRFLKRFLGEYPQVRFLLWIQFFSPSDYECVCRVQEKNKERSKYPLKMKFWLLDVQS